MAINFDWLPSDISKTVNAPRTNLPGSRSAEELQKVIDQFDVEGAERYRVRDVNGDGTKETFCNIYVSDVTRALYAEIPHFWEGHWQDVHAMAEWLRSGFGKWRVVSSYEAQAMADTGRPSLVIYDAPVRAHGHIAMVVPSHGKVGTWISQAGARNYRWAPILVGFGPYANAVEFWSHE